MQLRSLAPRYEPEQHDVYVNALVDALREDGIRNVALTGAYGTGKSSVLQRLSEMEEFRERTLELSLSTVGVTETRPEGESDANPAAWTKTNLIQKEIVKQILYRDAPEKTRGSRFRRLSRFRWRREIGIALGLGVLLFLTAWFVGLASPLIAWLGEEPGFGQLIFANAMLLVVLAGSVYAIRWLTHNRVFLEKLSAGPATVSLAATSSSFFDQYMDEIIYYFEKSGRDVVIFEDIDRFKDVLIFETLRALNGLLNGAEQVRRRRRAKPRAGDIAGGHRTKAARRPLAKDVKFVYALRDSVFEKLGNLGADPAAGHQADDEVRRANRTKFFDIVIPVVPFITHRNARDLMLGTMDGTGVSRDLINVAARFVADMRLITDMRNEYDIYANRLLGTTNQMPGLDPDRLFALILYKCVHMGDFEAIRLGTSDLDRLHDAWREIVSDSLTLAYEREAAASTQLVVEGATVARAKALGDRLEVVAHALTSNDGYLAYTQVTVGSTQFQGERLREPEFWRAVTTEGASVAMVNGQTGLNLLLSLQRLESLLGQPLDPAEWARPDREAELRSQQSARDDIDFLRHHDWGDLHGRPEFTSTPADGDPQSFADATERTLRSRLARSLVASEYLNDYFALYVSMYYGEHLRPRALNYAVHALDRGVPDIRYDLDGEDVEAIITDKGIDILRDRAAYNITVLDHLLATRPAEAELVVRNVAAWDKADSDFGEAYLHAGKQRVEFVRMLAPLLPRIILSIVSGAPKEVLAAVLDAALDYAGTEVGEPHHGWIVVDYYEQFPSIGNAAKDKSVIDLRKHKTIDAIAKLGIQLPATSPLDDTARRRVIELGAYELNSSNIEDLTGQPSLALDDIRAKSEPVFAAALGRLTAYVELIAAREEAVTIRDPKRFVSILNHANDAAVGDEHLVQIVEKSSPTCHVGDLTDVPESVWPTILSSKRATPSALNLLNYIDNVGPLDGNAAIFLDGTEAIEESELSDDDRRRLAVAILGAGSVIPSTAHRVQLALSINAPTPIPPALLHPEAGDLVGLMIEASLVADDELTLSSALIVDWPTREFALARSRAAPGYVSPASLPPEQLGRFFQSAVIPLDLKNVVLANILTFLPGADNAAVHAVSSFAAGVKADLPHATIEQLQAAGASVTDVVAFVANSTSSTIDEVRAALRALGDPYSLVADRGSSRPLVPDDDVHRRVLQRLQEAEIVSSHEPERGGRRVNLRRP